MIVLSVLYISRLKGQSLYDSAWYFQICILWKGFRFHCLIDLWAYKCIYFCTTKDVEFGRKVRSFHTIQAYRVQALFPSKSASKGHEFLFIIQFNLASYLQTERICKIANLFASSSDSSLSGTAMSIGLVNMSVIFFL